MKSKRFIFTISGLIIVVVALSFGLFTPWKSKPKKIECVGEELMAPAFTRLSLKGENVDFSEFKGKVILLNFWATWCPPCREEIPYLNELHNKYKRDGLVVIGIALDQGGPEKVRKFVEENGVEYIILMGDEAIVEAFGKIPGLGPIQGIPTTFIIDRKGQICRRFVGLTKKHVFEEILKQVL
ncbi:MAG: TlpA family protein disulfide reductase [Deltaproteobacteria bacterium]|nr:TlpA family protein disulfide reductase [Deltaproteobacteria bacterium]